MSAFKKLKLDDVFVYPYVSHKTYRENNVSSLGIQRYIASSGSFPIYQGEANYDSLLNYRSLNHLYYSDITISGSVEGSRDHFIPSTVFSGSRQLSDEMVAFSIPRDIVGNNIRPNSLNITFISGTLSAQLKDNGDGGVFVSTTSNNNLPPFTGSIVGDIIYSHGIINFTQPNTVSSLVEESIPITNIKFDSSVTLYKYVFNCPVSQYEFNYSQNPTSCDSNNIIYSHLTGSEFSPYVTSVGLYNDANELLAVAKLGSPIPISNYTDMTFVVELDM